MLVQLRQSLAPPQQLQPWLAAQLPGYGYSVTAGKLCVNHGLWAQIILSPKPNGVELGTGMPVVPRLLMVLLFLAGVVPGLIFAGVYYAAMSSKWSAMRAQIAAVMQGQPVPAGPGAAGTGAPAVGSAPAAPARPTSSISPLAPVWMLPIVVVLLGGGITATALAYDDGLEDYLRDSKRLEANEKTLAVTRQSLRRMQGGQAPPEGCPERAQRGSSSGRYRADSCWGCKKYYAKPTGKAAASGTVHQRAADWLVCPTAAEMAKKVERQRRWVERSRDKVEEAQLALVLWTPLGGIGLFGSFVLFGVWLWQNKKMRTKRRAELAAAAS